MLLRWLAREARPDIEVSACRSSKAPAGTEISRSRRCAKAGYGRDLARREAWNGAWRILRRGAPTSRARRGAACPAIPRTCTAATSRRLSTGSQLVSLPAQRQSSARTEVRLQSSAGSAAARRTPGAVQQSGGRRWCWPATTTSCRPTLDVSQAGALGRRRRCSGPRCAAAFQASGRARLDRCRAHAAIPASGSTFWDYFGMPGPRNAGLRIDHLLLSPASRAQLARRGSRSQGARLGEGERSC